LYLLFQIADGAWLAGTLESLLALARTALQAWNKNLIPLALFVIPAQAGIQFRRLRMQTEHASWIPPARE
jgi:hypothetical protein